MILDVCIFQWISNFMHVSNFLDRTFVRGSRLRKRTSMCHPRCGVPAAPAVLSSVFCSRFVSTWLGYSTAAGASSTLSAYPAPTCRSDPWSSSACSACGKSCAIRLLYGCGCSRARMSAKGRRNDSPVSLTPPNLDYLVLQINASAFTFKHRPPQPPQILQRAPWLEIAFSVMCLSSCTLLVGLFTI